MLEQTVFIIDDDDAVRDSIKELVESVGLKAKTFAHAHSFLQAYARDQAGCLVLDVRMARMSGLALQVKLNEMDVELPIVFITGHGDVGMAVEGLKAGAVDFIQKPYHEQNLLDSINNALEVNTQNRTKSEKKSTLQEHVARLTARQRDVMELLVEGHANRAIAKRLGISPRTVEVHRHRVLQKCAVESVPQLIRLFNQR